jgi:16S rRNA (cytosine967-C5)-methyltransferase
VPGAVTGRDLARAVLERVELEGAYASRALSAALDRAKGLTDEERGLATELVYGVLRRRHRLDRALEPLATRGLGGLNDRIRIVLRVAAYQMLFLDRIPAYAAVNDAVEASKRLGGRGVAGLTNAILRRLSRVGEPPRPDRDANPRGYLDAEGFPAWLIDVLLEHLPREEAVAFADGVARPAPITLRANTARLTRDELVERLGRERPDASFAPSTIAPDAVIARGLDALAATAAWRDGLFAVQDAGAQVVVELCGAAPGERILDACAGNGGKTAHLLALGGKGVVVEAADISGEKLDEAATALRRLGLEGASFARRDLTRPLTDGTPRYDRILLDAPCSGLGVLRRHPEALWRRRPEDLATLAALQLQMLATVAPVLRPGGFLTYAVCTFTRAECDEVLAAFLRQHPRFSIAPPEGGAGARVPWDQLRDSSGGVRTWPQRAEADGFFAVRLRRAS